MRFRLGGFGGDTMSDQPCRMALQSEHGLHEPKMYYPTCMTHHDDSFCPAIRNWPEDPLSWGRGAKSRGERIVREMNKQLGLKP